MTELLALPGWKTPPRPIDDWVSALAEAGHPPALVRESDGVLWIEVGGLRLRGYAVMEGEHVSAINFELAAPDPEIAARVLETVAEALGWELDSDEDGEEDDDDPDD